MSIAGISEEGIRSILNEHLTPSTSVKTPERLFGRQKNLTAISRALNSSGRQIVVGFGSGWFGFRENILRGYIRLRAESEGIELGRDQSVASS